MSDPYEVWNEDLLYSVEIGSSVVQVQEENPLSPIRPQRFKETRASPHITASPLHLTPTLSRSPLQALKQTPEGFLYSPFRVLPSLNP